MVKTKFPLPASQTHNNRIIQQAQNLKIKLKQPPKPLHSHNSKTSKKTKNTTKYLIFEEIPERSKNFLALSAYLANNGPISLLKLFFYKIKECLT